MRSTMIWTALCVVGLSVTAAYSDTVTFHPTPSNLWNLDHNTYVTWGINWTIPDDQYITDATLSIDNINDWRVEEGDILYIHLLDNPHFGAKKWNDNQGGGDAFAGQGLLLTTYTDDDDAPNPPEDFTYSLTQDQIDVLTTYDANGRFGFGFDPDCHYYNDGVSLTINTATVPEPATAGLMSLAGIVVLRVRRRLAKNA